MLITCKWQLSCRPYNLGNKSIEIIFNSIKGVEEWACNKKTTNKQATCMDVLMQIKGKII